ncbi:hypothetical protein [Piscirickettsia salmonis]|uniref:hypothetical protein n=1 Tax=Piscirickettsia salmonis TaxID=1238 RepID=UPI00094A480D|nr:hypothetical protein [Piscirickettsia salmonis]APS57546.1 hypothetical protein AVI52_10020 [Piscirickettsia salmonis]QHS31174.1 hypothetical protein GW535_00115 [Piscirickettsia salmonis]QHS31196.1 hypothetical protein GW535_00320 [Piscirickettsia salmonis]QIX54134.1 hypothetical protein GW536_00120 [Piscirickettsia salmonis]
MEPTETSSSTETKLERIAWLSAVDPGKVFNQVMHHFNLDSLLQCFRCEPWSAKHGVSRPR